MTMKFGFGQPLTRKEDDALLRGAGRYVADVDAGRHAACGRAALAARACALSRSAISTRVRAMPGVRLVLTARRRRRISGRCRRPACCPTSRSRFRRIRSSRATSCAMSAMPSPSSSPIRWQPAKDAAEAIAIDWQPLPHVIGAIDALKQGAPQVWPDRRGNLAFEIAVGDAAATKDAFAKAAQVVELTIVNQRLVTNYSTPAAWSPNTTASATR